MIPETILTHAITHIAQIHSQEQNLEEQRIKLRALEKDIDSRLERQRMQLDYNLDMAHLQASIVKNLLSSLIDRKVDAVQIGFMAVLSTFKDQADAYIRQREELQQGIRDASTNRKRSELRADMLEVDIQLRDIRQQAITLYNSFSSIVSQIGADMPNLSTEYQKALMLSGTT